MLGDGWLPWNTFSTSTGPFGVKGGNEATFMASCVDGCSSLCAYVCENKVLGRSIERRKKKHLQFKEEQSKIDVNKSEQEGAVNK